MARPPTIRARPSPAARQRHSDALAGWQAEFGADVDGLPGSVDRSVSALREVLYSANVDAYTNQLNRFARTVGHSPAATRNTLVPAAAARLRQLADESATSIVGTQLSRAAALREVYADDPVGAADAYDTWLASQMNLVTSYESGRAADQAMRDVLEHNPQLQGTEHLAPAETAGLDDGCDEALAAGDVELGQLGEFPAHPRCPHYIVRSFGTPEDPQSLWVGGPETD